MKKFDVGAARTDHRGERLLVDLGNDRPRLILLAAINPEDIHN
jgi:hypothetical protein